MSRKLYTGFSLYEFIWMIFLRLAALFGLIYCIAYFEENPIVISIVVLICLCVILFFGDDQITVYTDKVIQTTNSLSSLFVKSRGLIYEIQDIKSAYLQPAGSNSEIGFALLLGSLLPRRGYNNTTPIFLDMKNGKTVRIETDLEPGKMKKIVDLINSLTN